MKVAIPTLETPRLTLRAHTAKDMEASYAMWSDPSVTRYITGKPATREEVWSRLLRYVGHWAWFGYGFWAIESKSSGRFVGEVGFADFQRGLAPRFSDAPEMGWALSPAAQGKGFATEAVQAAIAWGESFWGPRNMVCMISPENVASIHVAEKCGYRDFEHTLYKGVPTILFERPARD